MPFARCHTLAIMLVACEFEHGTLAPIPRDDGAVPDAPGAADARGADAPPPDAPAPACPPAPADCTGFACGASPTSCYYYCPMPLRSASANARCGMISAGGCLATLNDAAEDACIRIHAGGVSLLYVGLVQAASGPEPAGGWGWYCGTSTYGPRWIGSEPTDSGLGGEDCAAITAQGGWVDVGCYEAFRYVCEAPAP